MVQVLRKKQKDLLYHKIIYLGVTSKFKPFYLRVLGGLMVLETDPDTEVLFGHFKFKVFFLFTVIDHHQWCGAMLLEFL